eukprot:3068377-Pyramimonas_sp.AAC.1
MCIRDRLQYTLPAEAFVLSVFGRRARRGKDALGVRVVVGQIQACVQLHNRYVRSLDDGAQRARHLRLGLTLEYMLSWLLRLGLTL